MGYWLRVLAIFLIAAPFSAMFAEPFFEAVLDQMGIATERWAAPVVTAMFEVFASDGFRFVSVAAIGVGIGIWVHWLASRFDRNTAQPQTPNNLWVPVVDIQIDAERLNRVSPWIEFHAILVNTTGYDVKVLGSSGYIYVSGEKFHPSLACASSLVKSPSFVKIFVELPLSEKEAEVFRELISKDNFEMDFIWKIDIEVLFGKKAVPIISGIHASVRFSSAIMRPVPHLTQQGAHRY
ncbi:MAG: hypothetical protein WDZ83_17365 [Rhizobiaceae bacterium]